MSRRTSTRAHCFVAASPHVILIDSRQALISYQDYHMRFAHSCRYHDMIKSHRHVVGAMLYGVCNEAQCAVEQGAAAAAFMTVRARYPPEH